MAILCDSRNFDQLNFGMWHKLYFYIEFFASPASQVAPAYIFLIPTNMLGKSCPLLDGFETCHTKTH